MFCCLHCSPIIELDDCNARASLREVLATTWSRPIPMVSLVAAEILPTSMFVGSLCRARPERFPSSFFPELSHVLLTLRLHTA